MSRRLAMDKEAMMELCVVTGTAPAETLRCIAEYDGDELIGGALFHYYNKQSIHGHIWLSPGRRFSRVWWWAFHDYPYNYLKVKNLVSIVRADNKRIQKLIDNLGGKVVGIIPAYFPGDVDGLIYKGTKEEAAHYKFLMEKATPYNYCVEAA